MSSSSALSATAARPLDVAGGLLERRDPVAAPWAARSVRPARVRDRVLGRPPRREARPRPPPTGRRRRGPRRGRPSSARAGRPGRRRGPHAAGRGPSGRRPPRRCRRSSRACGSAPARPRRRRRARAARSSRVSHAARRHEALRPSTAWRERGLPPCSTSTIARGRARGVVRRQVRVAHASPSELGRSVDWRDVRTREDLRLRRSSLARVVRWISGRRRPRGRRWRAPRA